MANADNVANAEKSAGKKKNKRMHPVVKILLILIIAAAAVFAGLLANVLIREGQVCKSAEEIGDFDAIIVLGAQVKEDGSPSVQLSWRLEKALSAWKIKAVPVVVCGGQGADEPMPEAEAMKGWLMDNGVAEEYILMEPESVNTEQNLENAGKILKGMDGVRTVVIVSSDYHVPRAMALAGDMGFEAKGLGAPIKPEYWIKNHFREALAWVKYWIKKIM